MADFVAITTQEEFEKRLKERLDRERQTAEKRWQDQVKERDDSLEALKTENANLKNTLEKQKEDKKSEQTAIEDLKKQIEGFQLKELKTKAAIEYGIPYSLSERIQGSTEDEIVQDAKNLSKYLGKAEPIAPLKDLEPHGLASGANAIDGAYAELARNLSKGE